MIIGSTGLDGEDSPDPKLRYVLTASRRLLCPGWMIRYKLMAGVGWPGSAASRTGGHVRVLAQGDRVGSRAALSGVAYPNSPLRTPATNARHSAGVNLRTGLSGSLPSRTAMPPPGMRAHSTQLWPLGE
jgi:hypothetical protein